MSRRTAIALGVLVSAVLFALAHGEPLQFAGLAALGVVLALLVQRTKRLVPSFVTHASFNATALAFVIHQRVGH
jgi:membrane protease YdiL (CAAX protease family)